MIYVLLTDSNDGTAMIACRDDDKARAVGWAAVSGSGGVSAWVVPDHAITDVEAVIKELQDGGRCSDLDSLNTVEGTVAVVLGLGRRQ